jgi:hypothetical protein
MRVLAMPCRRNQSREKSLKEKPAQVAKRLAKMMQVTDWKPAGSASPQKKKRK